MKTKNIPYYLLLISLTIGASLILGFLSFGGAFALWPVLLPAFAAFALSVAYEGEIYLQNIKGALNKLFFKRDYLKSFFANQFLLKNFPDTTAEDCPQFFKDYETQLNLLHLFDHKRLDEVDEAKKQQVEKILRNMEKWFTHQLFTNSTENLSPYEKTLKEWLATHSQAEWQMKYAQRRSTYNIVKVFSLLATIFMSLGTTYLLAETFAAIPVLATIPFAMLPFLVIPMAVVAGAAYGLLTYNAITDMINNNTIKKWYNKIRKELSNGITLHSVFLAATAVLLVGLAVALTICTAGTWWTVVKTSRPIFNWLTKMPSFIMGVIHPIITGLSSLVFNLENTSESLEEISKATKSKQKKHSHEEINETEQSTLEFNLENTSDSLEGMNDAIPQKKHPHSKTNEAQETDDIKKGFFTRCAEAISAAWNKLEKKENKLQIFNPFRILLKITIVPLRILFFLGHLVSIGVTSDRVPGIPEIVSAILGFISEFFEDAHYFFTFGPSKHHHSHGPHNATHPEDHARHTKKLLKEHLGSHSGHNHDVDIPTRVLKFVFSPLYALAALWDSWASQQNQGHETRKTLSFKTAYDKQRDLDKISHVDLADKANPSIDWQTHHAIYRIERFKEKHLQKTMWSKTVANEKIEALTNLQNDLREGNFTEVTEKLKSAATNPTYHKQRFFGLQNEKTSTESFLEELPSQISPAA